MAFHQVPSEVPQAFHQDPWEAPLAAHRDPEKVLLEINWHWTVLHSSELHWTYHRILHLSFLGWVGMFQGH